MANKLQKFLLNLSTICPLLFISIIVYWLEYEIPWIINIENGRFQFMPSNTMLFVLFIVTILGMFRNIVFLSKAKKHLEVIPIKIEEISSNDNWAVLMIVTYAFPLATLCFKSIIIPIATLLVLVAAALLFLSNSVFPSPILLFCGYHFYKIKTIDGNTHLNLISKKKRIPNKNTVSRVIRVFDSLFIEVR